MNPSPDPLDRPAPEAAWAPYQPAADRPWDIRRAGHLYRRAGFAASWTQLQQALQDGPQVTVDRLLHPAADVAAFDAELDDNSRPASSGNSTEALRAWWLRRMIHTPHPLQERMTLFWHGHFAIGNTGVNSASLMASHLQQLRAGALGSYRALVRVVIEDPALYLWLRCPKNRQAQLNENVARQLLHVYGPGAAACSDADVQAAARALTGRFVLRNQLRFIEREFDDGEKALFGQTGPWTAQDAVRITLDHPGTASALVRKLYAWFLSEDDEPADELLAPLVAELRQHDDVLQLVETMLRSNLFFSDRSWRRRIKSPVEFAVGLVRALEADVSTLRLAQHLAELGQNLYQPPTSHGWAGGRHWLNQGTLVGRQKLAAALLSGAGPYEGRLDPAALVAKQRPQPPRGAAGVLADLLLQSAAVEPAAGAAEPDLRALAVTLAQSPEYQLG